MRLLSGVAALLLAGFAHAFSLDNTYNCDPHSEINASRVLLQSDAQYATHRMDQYAQYLGTHAQASAALSPTLLVDCASEAEVQSAVRFAAACGYKVTARSGGHSYTGSSSCNFDRCMQLDLGSMTKTTVRGNGVFGDSASITTGPGISLLGFAEVTMQNLVSVPHGGCSAVGFGGHFQSSAWGMMSHSHGSGMDHISSFRMVLANGSVAVVSRNDANDTLYKSVLGSAPGSWGIITEFTLDAVQDKTVPWTRAIFITMYYSKSTFKAALTQAQFIAKDQEEKNLRDMKLVFVTAPPTEKPDTEVNVEVFMLWTGIDSGEMTQKWHDLYLQPFYDLPHKSFPETINVPMPLSVATRIYASTWTNHDDRYAIQAYHSDHWWSEEFIDEIADEVDARANMLPWVYPNFQFLPLGHNSQWARNAGMNSLSWRDTRAYVDDWMFTKNDSLYEPMRQRMVDFRERTKKHWQYTTPPYDRSTWMTPMTTYPNSTDLRNETIAWGYFPDFDKFRKLQLLKAELDPTDVFSNKGTIPMP
jgi:hypothetical protein